MGAPKTAPSPSLLCSTLSVCTSLVIGGCADGAVVEGSVLGVVVSATDTPLADVTWIALRPGANAPVGRPHVGSGGVVPGIRWALEEGHGAGSEAFQMVRVWLDSSADAKSVFLTLPETEEVQASVILGDDEFEMGIDFRTIRSWRSRDWQHREEILVAVPRCSGFRAVAGAEYGGDVAAEWLKLFPEGVEGWNTERFRVVNLEEIHVKAASADTTSVPVLVVEVDTVRTGASIGTMWFGFDSAIVRTDEATPVRDAVASWLRDSPALRVRIEGHTDTVGTKDYNKWLGMARARSVLRFLSERAEMRERFDTVSLGESRSLDTIWDAKERSPLPERRNRRVELLLSSPVIVTDTTLVSDTVITPCAP